MPDDAAPWRACLIRCNTLPASFAERLDPYVREEFLHLHGIAGEPADLDE